MPEWFIDIAKTAGCAALVFYCFFLVQKSGAKQAESLQEASTKQIADVIQKGFDMVKVLLEQQLLQTAYLQKIDTKVSNNLWCPIVKRMVNEKGELFNEPSSNATKN